MPIAPSLIGGGLSGWTFLQVTLDRQVETFADSPDIARDEAHFRAVMGEADGVSLSDFMTDRRVLKTALQAFGLESELDKGAFVRRIIEDGPDDENGFARRLNNSDYLALASVIRPDERGVIRISKTQIEDIITRSRQNAFEQSVGEQDNDLRLALNFSDSISELASESSSDRAFWFRVLGSSPLREVFTTAFLLPDGFSNIDIDKQVETLARRAEQFIEGDLRQTLATESGIEKMTQRFLLQRQLQTGPSAFSSGALALTILGSGLGTSGLTGLVLSNA